MTDEELAERLRADFPTMPDAVLAACIAARWHPHQFSDLIAPWRQPPTNPTVGPAPSLAKRRGKRNDRS